jgi:hypothetical protein
LVKHNTPLYFSIATDLGVVSETSDETATNEDSVRDAPSALDDVSIYQEKLAKAKETIARIR